MKGMKRIGLGIVLAMLCTAALAQSAPTESCTIENRTEQYLVIEPLYNNLYITYVYECNGWTWDLINWYVW